MAIARLSQRWLSLYLQIFLAASAFAQSCYFPNGNRAPADVPCSSDEFTFCCRHNDICMSNGICMHAGHQPYGISRGSCTDKSWKSDNCPSACRDRNPGGGITILNVGFDNGQRYCCHGVVKKESSIECSNGDEPFSLPEGTMILGRAALANLTSSTPPTESTVEPTSASSSTSLPSPTPTASADDKFSSSLRSVAIGAGVGVPLGVLALAALGWAVYERRKNRNYPAPGPYDPNTLPSSEVKHYNPGFARPQPAELSGGDVGRPELEGGR